MREIRRIVKMIGFGERIMKGSKNIMATKAELKITNRSILAIINFLIFLFIQITAF